MTDKTVTLTRQWVRHIRMSLSYYSTQEEREQRNFWSVDDDADSWLYDGWRVVKAEEVGVVPVPGQLAHIYTLITETKTQVLEGVPA